MKRILTTFKREKGDGLFYPSFVCLWRKRLEVLMDGGGNTASEKRYRDTGDRGRSGSSTSLPEDDSPEGRIVIATVPTPPPRPLPSYPYLIKPEIILRIRRPAKPKPGR